MADDTPTLIPEKGFYYHYKHDPKGPVNEYAYEVIGIARHTEEGTFTVLYRPLYENDWFKPADYQARPLEMFKENVEKDGEIVPRFTLVTDPQTIEQFEKFKMDLYSN